MDYDRYGADITQRYILLTSTLTSLYQGQIAMGAGINGIPNLRAAGNAALTTFLGDASDLTRDYFATLGGGERAAGALSHYYLLTLREIGQRNLNQLIVGLAGDGARLANVLTRPAGAIGQLLQQRGARPQFTARDSAGRAWAADKLVRTIARDFAYQAYVDAAIGAIIASGTVMAKIVYPDPAHEHHNLEVNLQDLGQLRQAIFHPNATARLVRYTDVQA